MIIHYKWGDLKSDPGIRQTCFKDTRHLYIKSRPLTLYGSDSEVSHKSILGRSPCYEQQYVFLEPRSRGTRLSLNLHPGLSLCPLGPTHNHEWLYLTWRSKEKWDMFEHFYILYYFCHTLYYSNARSHFFHTAAYMSVTYSFTQTFPKICNNQICCCQVPCYCTLLWRPQAQVCLSSMRITQYKANADFQINGEGGFHSVDSSR